MPVEALKAMGADLEGALDHVNVASYVIDRAGVVRWMNRAARAVVGDQVGRQFTSVVAPEDTRRARELFARKIVGNTEVTDAPVAVLDAEGGRVAVEISSVPLRQGEHVIGVFGQVSGVIEEPHSHPELHLTPRQEEVLRLLERGRSTVQIADELHVSRETVRTMCGTCSMRSEPRPGSRPSQSPEATSSALPVASDLYRRRPTRRAPTALSCP
jgi:PAS domain S-box-containing protein